MDFNAAELAALVGGSQQLAIFFRLDVEPVPVRLWLGFGPIDVGVNVNDPSGATYNGMGEIQNIPAFNQMINGKASRVEFALSGVSGEILKVASGGDAQQVKGKRAAIGLGIMDQDWALLGPIHWCAHYYADFLGIDQDGSDATGSVTRGVRLSCGTMMTGRRRPALAYFSNQDQRRRYPGDRFCEHTSEYANGFAKTWPTFPPP